MILQATIFTLSFILQLYSLCAPHCYTNAFKYEIFDVIQMQCLKDLDSFSVHRLQETVY